jgi:hypothetical protein
MTTDRTATVRAMLEATVVVGGCSPRFVKLCSDAAVSVRCAVRAATLQELSTAVARYRPLVIVLRADAYKHRRAEYDELAVDVKAVVLPVASELLEIEELEGQLMAAVAEAERKRK